LPGYELITGKILKELPTVGIKYLAQLFNTTILKGYFPRQNGKSHRSSSS
jgi:hypothetical protein